MMKKDILTLLLVLFISCKDENDSLTQLERKSFRIKEESLNCLKRLNINSDELCSFKEKKIKSFDSLDDCRSEVEKMGYKVQISNIESTKRAIVDYDKKEVLFKKDVANKIDCTHEYFHIMQNEADTRLSAKTRRGIIKEFEKELFLKAQEVESLERTDKKQAMQISQDLQSKISALSNLRNLSSSFDEIEAHLYILKNCKEFGCSLEDKDIAISNLFVNKDYLNQELKDYIQNNAKVLIKQKSHLALKKASKKWKRVRLTKAKKLFRLSEDDFIGFLEYKNIKLYRIDSFDSFGLKDFEKHMLSKKLYESIDIIPKKMFHLIGDKIIKGEALGKHVCNNNKNFIIINRLASKATLIHEFLHSMQTSANKDYCDSDMKQKNLFAMFKSGKLSRARYEKAILYYQSLANIAEFDIYEFLAANRVKLNEYELSNALANYNKYRSIVK